MPAHRKPTAVHELTGSFKEHAARGRARAREPKPTRPLGDPPDWLSEAEASIWRDLNDWVVPGVLTISDRFAVEVWCKALHLYRTGQASNKDVAVMNKGFAWFGISPSDRSRVQVPEQESPAVAEWGELVADTN